ncbi:GSCFA domain-containing protein [Sulfitobacter sp. W027]|uniref:GSCFA domain-containing protein n=1 Tax=Sulfitobacter sp. W027 TaxID=2867025 RepID=UPI0021A8044E|nr:GSCFA domain-containing protein [Sulfitobacter sp. W027]UWR33752.1 GSCFA domain-containing protein [Sulfitobacter sp. W027]
MTHPYHKQPDSAFWRKTISSVPSAHIRSWYSKRFEIAESKIATAGSCFAQHIGRNLREKKFNYLDAEPAPNMLSEKMRYDFGYDMYSARYGNVYTSRQLLQLFKRAFGMFSPVECVWRRGDGVVDPFRPTIEPEPFSTVRELEAQRAYHLDCVAQMFRSAEVFVFTLGLTESWSGREDGANFPLCPGTAGGSYDPQKHVFENLSVSAVLEDMHTFFSLAREINPTLKFLLTVSPVPLAATATGHQVAVATAHSKAILRAAAGELYDVYDYVDYFPSFEIITSPFMQGSFFDADWRGVTTEGVAQVMQTFFSQHVPPAHEYVGKQPLASNTSLSHIAKVEAAQKAENIRCDEELLGSYAGGRS